jgi:hypothetical protein
MIFARADFVKIDIGMSGATVQEFEAIGEDPEKFKAFLSRVA